MSETEESVSPEEKLLKAVKSKHPDAASRTTSPAFPVKKRPQVRKFSIRRIN